jgi:hypothetical protein
VALKIGFPATTILTPSKVVELTVEDAVDPEHQVL